MRHHPPSEMPLASEDLLTSDDERSQELGTIATIYPELILTSPFSATITLPVSPILPVPVSFDSTDAFFPISHFPPLILQFHLPESYPDTSPPEFDLSTTPSWLPPATITRLKSELTALWSDLGHSQIIFTAIDHLQQSTETAFNLSATSLPSHLQSHILTFDTSTKKSIFEHGTYECGICLEPKKGTQCHQLRSCIHVFCLPCLRSYFSTMITEGHISSIVCSDPSCVKKATQLITAPPTPPNTPERKTHKAMLPPTLPPSELTEIGIDPKLVTRYIQLKQKAALEKDPETVYCPRRWCQAPSRESITLLNTAMAQNHTTYYLTDSTIPLPPNKVNTKEAEEEEAEEKGLPKLQICSSCALAFCRICHNGWHGDLVICRSKDVALTAEEIASEVYLKENTTPCPECNSPVLKSHGCNHMICKCLAHFCFLCSAYLPPKQPYKHFNTAGSSCYKRLWEGESGDGEHARLLEEGRVGLQGEELPPVEPAPAEIAAAEVERQRREDERNRAPFVVGVVPPRVVPRRGRVRGRFADLDETDEEEEDLEVDFDDVPD